MRIYYPIISMLILCLIFPSCEEPVDFNLDEDSRLVVTSHFSANKALVVYVSESQTVTSNQATRYVENASISVFSGNTFIEMMEFVFDDNIPYYRTVELNPLIGELYTIKVNVPGHDILTATNSIPVPVPIQSVYFQPTIDDADDNNTMVDFTVSVTIQDPIEYDNYYHIFLYQELIPFSIGGTGDTILSSTIMIESPSQVSLSNTDLELQAEKIYGSSSFLIDDTSFRGELYVISFSGNYAFDPSKYVPGDFIVELRTVSKEYFKYYSSLNSQANGNGPLNDASVLDDNIINGEGIFAGYSSTIKGSKLQN